MAYLVPAESMFAFWPRTGVGCSLMRISRTCSRRRGAGRRSRPSVLAVGPGRRSWPSVLAVGPGRRSRPSVPAVGPGQCDGLGPGLQVLHDCTDAEAAEAARCDLRWNAACGFPFDHGGFDPSTLMYRRRLAKSDRPHRVRDAVAKVTGETGVLKGPSSWLIRPPPAVRRVSGKAIPLTAPGTCGPRCPGRACSGDQAGTARNKRLAQEPHRRPEPAHPDQPWPGPWERNMGTRPSDDRPAGTQGACGHPAQSVRLVTGGKSDHVAGPERAWLTAA